jgi:hypothetical protein
MHGSRRFQAQVPQAAYPAKRSHGLSAAKAAFSLAIARANGDRQR